MKLFWKKTTSEDASVSPSAGDSRGRDGESFVRRASRLPLPALEILRIAVEDRATISLSQMERDKYRDDVLAIGSKRVRFDGFVASQIYDAVAALLQDGFVVRARSTYAEETFRTTDKAFDLFEALNERD